MKNNKMNRSQSNVPFSWEEKPGIPKFNTITTTTTTTTKQNTPTVRPLHKPQLPPTYYNTTTIIDSPSSVINAEGYWNSSKKISPPPCNSSGGGNKTPNRSNNYSLTKKNKGLLWWRHLDDPFAAAMKECTKNNIKPYGLPSEGKIWIGSNGYYWNKNIVFSCKKSSSCDVRENNLVRLQAACNNNNNNNNNKLPPLIPLQGKGKKKR